MPTLQPIVPGSSSVASGTSYNTSTTPTAEIPIGLYGHVRVAPTTASIGIFVRVGVAGTASAGVADIYIPYGSSEIFSMGNVNSSICLYSTSAGTAQVTIVALP
jgi:hypothetical protein